MNRPRHIWLLFGLSLVVVLTALGRVTLAALNLDDTQRQAESGAQLEERIRLAWGRIESVLGGLLATEEARPPEDYQPFRKSSRVFVATNGAYAATQALVPSSLLGFSHPYVRLHFQIDAEGPAESPQVPTGVFLTLAQATGISSQMSTEAQRNLLEFQLLLAPKLWSQTATNRTEPTNILSLSVTNRSLAIEPGQSSVWPSFTAHWQDEELILWRELSPEGSRRIQGCWLNWATIRTGLLERIQDLLPEADLRVLSEPTAAAANRRTTVLRGVVLELLPGVLDPPPAATWSPVRTLLLLAWVAVLCAAIAVAMLLEAAVSLSERRAAFVSAVTHELRTPLTTFKMYSEMLAEDMVSDPAQRRRYLETLCTEANRLGHLVENVLTFARLERVTGRNRIERLPIGVLLERIVPRLRDRTEQAGTHLLIKAPEPAATECVYVDPSAVEQILFNLVDNACKYGTGARVGAAPIELEVLPTRGRRVRLRVRDHGPGIPAGVASRLFQPFCKSADEAAVSAPGIGLGLALCRRLARSMGGELAWDREVTEGAGFELSLPTTARASEPTLA